MRPEDQERILAELESRVVSDQVRRSSGGTSVEEILRESLYHERRRLKDERTAPARVKDAQFWDRIQEDVRRSPDRELTNVLRQVVQHYGREIAGNFDDRVYQAVTRVMPSALSLLLNAASPKHLLTTLPNLPSIENAIQIQGEVDQLKLLHERGTVILVPTHVSNLDSLVAGYALYRLGLPPFIYGAGLNLFSNPLISFFMHNLGAYTVDRKKSDPVYKEVLKHYATLTLEFGYDNIFFPGGTRCRSGALERRLKLGLLGAGVTAYANNLLRGAPNPKVYIVPATFSYELVLEAETLIDDFLKEVGKSRYIIEDDEFSKPQRVLDFMSKLLSLNSKICVTISSAIDPFGNPVDEHGESIDPCGRRIDCNRYLWVKGKPTVSADRDAEYTREVGEQIVAAYARDNLVFATHVTAKAVFGLLRRQDPKMSTLRILRGASEDTLSLADVYRETARLLDRLRDLERRKLIRLSDGLLSSLPEEVVSEALSRFAAYHTKPMASRRGDRLIPNDRNLLLYYQNRLEGYGLESDGLRPTLTSDHRALAS